MEYFIYCYRYLINNDGFCQLPVGAGSFTAVLLGDRAALANFAPLWPLSVTEREARVLTE